MTTTDLARVEERALLVPENRGSWVRTWHNVDSNGGGDLLRNTPDGWVSGTDPGRLWWRGSDQLDALLASGSGGYRRIVGPDGIVYTLPEGGRNPMGIAAVGRATSLIADTISGLPWRQVTDDQISDAPRWIGDPQMLRPDDRITSASAGANPLSNVAFWSQVIIAQLWKGFAPIWTPIRDAAGQIKPPIFLLNPDDVTVRAYPQDGKEAGVWLDNADGGPVRLDRDECLILPGQGPYDANGLAEGVISRYGRLLGLSEVIQAYTVGTFTAGVPAGYLRTQNPNLSQEQADELRGEWESRHGGGQRGIAVLNSAVEFHPLAFSPVDSALIDAGHFTLAQIALAFGLEPYMLGAPADSETYANIVDRQSHFATFSLLPWTRRIEASLSAEFATGTDLRIDLRGLLRADAKTRYEGYAIALDSGWLTVDEIRALEDLGPLPAKPAPPAPPSWESVGLPSLVQAGIVTREWAAAQVGAPPSAVPVRKSRTFVAPELAPESGGSDAAA
jgi:HK97 family phage portal protein